MLGRRFLLWLSLARILYNFNFRSILVEFELTSFYCTTRRSFVAFVMLCGTNDRIYGQQKLRSSIMIMQLPILHIRLSLWNTTFLWFVRLPTPLIWLRVTFGYFPSRKCCSEEPDLSQEKTSCGIRWPGWSSFWKTHSSSVSNNGGSAGRSVCIIKETTLKGMRVFYLLINKCISTDQRLDTFWTHLMYNFYLFNTKLALIV